MPYNQQGQWVPGGSGGSLEAEESVKRGLGGAFGLISSPQPINYPGYVPSQGRGPTQQPYIGYTPNQPMAQINTPNYQLGFGNNSSYQSYPQNPGYSGYQQGQGDAPAFGFRGAGTSASGFVPPGGSSIQIGEGYQRGQGDTPGITVNEGYQRGQGDTSGITVNEGYQRGQGESTGRAVIDSGYQREQGGPTTTVWGDGPDFRDSGGPLRGPGGENPAWLTPGGTGGMQTNQGNLPNPLLPPEWNNWNPSAPPQYQEVSPLTGTAPWQFNQVDPYAAAAGFNWQNTPLGMQSVNPQNAQAANFNWQNTGLGMERIQNPYTRFNPAGGDPTYQKSVAAPTYQGLMGGDYDALQKALQTPGEIEAKRAYEQGLTNLTNQMGGRGLYGSSIMANQQRQALDQPYMDTLQKNAATAAATRYGQQAADLQNKNQFGMNIYGQQMGENQAANQMGFNTWEKRLGENLAGQGYGLEAQKANQNTFANLQGLGLQQGLAQNQAGLDYSKLLTGVNQQNAANNLQGQLANQSTYGQLQGLLSNQGLAQNQAGLDYSKLLTGVNQQNVANSLAQNTQRNDLGLNYAQMQTEVAGQNANRALQQATALNALRSGDFQQYNNLMGQQNLARNTFAGNTYGQQLGQLQNMNQFNLSAAQLGMQQNQNLYQAGVADAARRQEYNLAGMTDQREQQEAIRQWQNQQALEQFQYQLAQGQYANNQNTNMINQYLSLAGLGAPLAQTQMNNQTASNNSLISGGMTGLGLLGKYFNWW